MNEQQIITDVLNTASKWAEAFNSGDANGCASFYTVDATMHAEPVAQVKGQEEIQKFWQQLIDDGFAEVKYLDPKVSVISETEAELCSPWSMNLARGMIHREIWSKQADGRWLLSDDHFEIQEQTPA